MIRSVLRFILWLVCGPQVMLVWLGVGFAVYMIGGECALLQCPPHRTAAASLSVNPAVRHYYTNAPGVSLLCGLPAAPAAFAHGVVTQKYRGCQITGHYSVRSNIPTPTVAPIPSPTLPAPTLIPLPTSAPTAIPSDDPVLYLLGLINAERQSHDIAPLTLNATQSACSVAHSVHMAAVGFISHDQFPADVCVPWSAVAENVGEASGSERSAILADFQQMIAEPYTPGCSGNHHCSVDYSGFTEVGIGIAPGSGLWFVTEDFIG